jgi:prepilin-type N-terminal cleavage/methylation domain-containing protein
MKRRGFTIIEIIMAVAIILVGVIAVARINPLAYRSSTLTKDHLTALRIARNVIERVRARPFGADVTDLQGPVTVKGEAVEDNPVSQVYQVATVQTALGATSGTVDVTVTWTEGTGTGSAGTAKSLTLTGGLCREP